MLRPFFVWMVAPVDMPTSSGAPARAKSKLPGHML